MKVEDTGYILAGGQSRRMGQDKLFIELEGTSLLMRTITTCRSAFAEVKLVAKQSGRLEQFDCEVVLDWPHADGPLAGLIAALQNCKQDCCFVTAADLYDLDREIIARLINSYDGEQYLGVQEVDGGQPLCGIYHRSALPHLVTQGEAGKWRMREVIAGLDHRMMPLDRKHWRNINRPADVAAIGNNHG